MTALFPKWTNKLPAAVTTLVLLGAPAVVGGVWYYFSPKFTDVGYSPVQPVPYSHKLHAGFFGMDCRYCHQNVEKGPHATVPPTQTCMNCHTQIKPESLVLEPVRASLLSATAAQEAGSAQGGEAIEWVKVHMLPDFAYFDHSAHFAAGVGCTSCHGRIDQMEVVRQVEPLSMSWCLECHRNPENHVRPVSEVTNMRWEHDQDLAFQLISEKSINPPTHCSACHR